MFNYNKFVLSWDENLYGFIDKDFNWFYNINMEQNVKLEILNKALSEHGLTLNNRNVYDFFFAKRCVEPVMTKVNNDGSLKVFKHTQYIKPEKTCLLPSDFENASYGSFDNLMDWYLYENSESNPLVWDNVGKPKFDVKTSFVNRRQLDSVKQDIQGNIFNINDGNHRLLTLIINHYLESMSTKTDAELEEVDNKYKMYIDVSLPFSAELCDKLDEVAKEYVPYNKNQVVPMQAREFRQRSFENCKDGDACVVFDRENNIFNFNLNEERFSGNEKELLEYLNSREKQLEPIMTWDADGIYYASCNNYIFKSKDKNKIAELLPKIKKRYKNNEFDFAKFLAIKDVDNNTYDIDVEGFYMEEQEKAKEYARIIDDILNSEYRDVILSKLENADFYAENLKDNISRAFDFIGGFSMPDLRYKNLTKQEYKEKVEMFYALEDNYQYITESKQDNFKTY